MSNLFEIPEISLSAFENITKLTITVHDLAQSIWRFLPPGRLYHQGPYCTPVKSGFLDARCRAFEVTRLRGELTEYPQGRVQVCHAGLVEWMYPVRRGEGTEWVLFAGQRTPGADLRSAFRDRGQHTLARDLPWPKGMKLPPPVGEDEAQSLLEALRQLGARLILWRDELEAAGMERPGRPPAGRKAQIIHFLEHSHRRPIGLADLAAALHLSESRVAHLTGELFGRTFGQLLTEARLRTAASLLRNSDLQVHEVAAQSGFGDVSRFHRVFRQCLGLTPARHRRQAREGV